jgi:hypothetical protein
MSGTNRYSPPRAHVENDATASSEYDDETLQRIASGQRMVIMALIASFVAVGMRSAAGQLSLVVSLGASVVSIVGVVRLAGGLGASVITRVLYALGCLVPLVNLLVMIHLSMRANKALRAAGYRIGLLGAKKPD